MKFLVEYTKNIEQRALTYVTEDCSFDMEPVVLEIDRTLVLNKLNLTVVDSKIVQIWGFCGFAEWMKSNYEVPKYKKGVLKVEHDFKYDVAYGIYDEDLPVYVNTQTGWVCIGYPKKSGQAVEFINNCVAVIDGNGKFLSLWLKPQSLPKLSHPKTGLHKKV